MSGSVDAQMVRDESQLQQLLRLYSTLLHTAPVVTKSVTAACIFGISDIVAQRIETGQDGIDWLRLLSGALVGLCYFGPAAHAWYAAVQRLFPRSTIRAVLTKMALGQLIFGPIFTVVYFAAALVAAGGLPGLSGLPDKVAEDLLPTIVAGLGFWPLVDLFSFAVIAKRKDGEAWLPLFVNAASFLWQVYLSLQARAHRRGAGAVVSQAPGHML